ncbi:hypothetical protein WN51_02469 [Melipona quadrifasciata]|uniref:Uncharacterized protein n=1 Tax=Melipona quadrifasciata TaxID=166423 RepID=A0A0N0BEG1_9HYME|nr:hypothetical protein WN51_02469 [Melipona quadrifasciata]
MEERVCFSFTLYVALHGTVRMFSDEEAKGTIVKSVQQQEAQRFVNDETCRGEIFLPPSLELHACRSREITQVDQRVSKQQPQNIRDEGVFRIVVGDKGSKLRRRR